MTTEYSLNNLDVADMDGDGDMDLITCEHKGPKGQQKLQIFANDGTGEFTEHILDRGKESHLGARVADMDGDGDYDIVSAAWDYPEFLHLWRNDAVAHPSTSPRSMHGQHRSTRQAGRPWKDKDHPYRVLLQVGAAGYLRKHAVVEVEIDFTQLLRQHNAIASIDPAGICLYEQKKNSRTRIPFQFDRTEDFHARTRAKGSLTFMLNGITARQQARRFELYFGGRADSVTGTALSPLVSVQAETEHEGQESFIISTPNGRYAYHRLGAGFASLEDREGSERQ